MEAYAKINLTLDITGRDQRGYHLLSSVFSEVSLSDTVTISRGESGITLSCSDPRIPTDDRNLCVKAAKAFLNGFGLLKENFHIDLIKRIPSCAGLGGGSSDAAAVIKLLCGEFGISPKDEKVQAIALSVGADVPFFLYGGCCHVRGIGENVTPLPSLTDGWILLAKTSEAASTPEVYRLYDRMNLSPNPSTPDFLEALREGRDISPYVSNHLTAPASSICPSVLRLKENMMELGALCSEMSGSGSAVFGLFQDQAKAQYAENNIDAEWKQLCRIV